MLEDELPYVELTIKLTSNGSLVYFTSIYYATDYKCNNFYNVYTTVLN